VFDQLREDWQTYENDIWRQGFWVMCVYRFGNWRYGVRPAWLRKPCSLLYKLLRTVSQIATGIELPCETRVGRRLLIEHFGAIIVSGDAVIGDDVIIRQGVTIGLRTTGKRGAPVIGDRVDIGAGAKLLGDIRIGNDAVIGANAVVLCDIPDGALAVGVPAVVKIRENSAGRSGQGCFMLRRACNLCATQGSHLCRVMSVQGPHRPIPRKCDK
jgi:serine O-acetyltransferase